MICSFFFPQEPGETTKRESLSVCAGHGILMVKE